MVVTQEQFKKMSAMELGRDHDFMAKLLGVSVICPTSGNLVEVPFNNLRVEDRELYILCDCKLVHEIGGF